MSAPIEGDLQDLGGDAERVAHGGQFGEVGEVVSVFASRVGGLRQTQDGTDFSVGNIAVQKPLKDPSDVLTCVIQSRHTFDRSRGFTERQRSPRCASPTRNEGIKSFL